MVMMVTEGNDSSCGSGGSGVQHHTMSSSSSPAQSRQQRQKVEVYNEILRRLKDSGHEEAMQPGFHDQLWAHFNRLPTRSFPRITLRWLIFYIIYTYKSHLLHRFFFNYRNIVFISFHESVYARSWHWIDFAWTYAVELIIRTCVESVCTEVRKILDYIMNVCCVCDFLFGRLGLWFWVLERDLRIFCNAGMRWMWMWKGRQMFSCTRDCCIWRMILLIGLQLKFD